MIPTELHKLISGGESLTVEFKRSQTDITKDVYETVCAFSNREGGHIFLGVKDNGEILGVDPDRVDKIKKEFVTSINNENKMYPPLYLSPVDYTEDGKTIIYIRVPVSSDVCRCNGRIYDRNHESDIDITHHSDEVYQLYARKSGTYFVNKVFPAFNISDLRPDLFDRARRMTRSRTDNHPWLAMSDEEILRSTGLILKDASSGNEGLTLAAILLFGTDQLILSVLPQHKTDAIFRVFNTDRYDDRDVIITNLFESYDRLLDFGKKHLNDSFHIDGVQRVSARDHILREIISNLLSHRDYSNAFVAKFVIEKDKLYTENANLTHGHGPLDPASFQPFPKNPPISKVFREVGLADELGSGMRNTYKYTKMYSGGEPKFVEDSIFRITVPLNDISTTKVGPDSTAADFGTTKIGTNDGTVNDIVNDTVNGTVKLSEKENSVLKAIIDNTRITKSQISMLLDISESTVARATKKLKELGIIHRSGADKDGHWVINKEIFR